MTTRKRSNEERALLERARRVMPGGNLGNLALDLVIKEGRGSRVRDVSGNEYIDYLLGSGPMVVGHAHPRVVAAVQEQVERGSTFFADNEDAILLADSHGRAMRGQRSLLLQRDGGYALRDARGPRVPRPG